MGKAEIEQRRQAFIRFIKVRGLKANSWAKRAGISSPGIIYNYVRPGPDQTASISHDNLAKLAKSEGVPIEAMFDPNYNPKRSTVFVTSLNDSLSVNEIDFRAGAGGIGLIDHQDNGEALSDIVVDKWVFPKSLFAGKADVAKGSFCIITITGDSMAPLIEHGARVLVNMADRSPTPPGFFVVYDGLGVLVKRVQFIPFSEPPRVKISSVNPEYEPYERTLDEAHIQGRVLGQWHWL